MMNRENRYYPSYLWLLLWVVGLVAIGAGLGTLTKAALHTWYGNLNRSMLTPPNYIFGVAWTILYTMLAICGWIIWNRAQLPRRLLLKSLYIMQLLLNWSWTPLFFRCQLIDWSLGCLIVMDLLVATIIYVSHRESKIVAVLMNIYLLWLLFATYLNFYIWQYN